MADGARRELKRLADQEAALRRVAMLVARGVPPRDVFAAVAREVGLLLGVGSAYLARYDADGTATGVATWSPGDDDIPVGRRVTLEGDSVVGIVSRTGRPARVDDYEHAAGSAAALVRELGLGSSVGAPIVVDQRLWGALIVSFKHGDRALPPDTESRVQAFTELVAMAISNTETHVEVARLAEEQAALRRVATLVAEGAGPTAVFDAVAAEIERLLDAEGLQLSRYEPDDELTIVAHRGIGAERLPPGSRVSHAGQTVATLVRRSGRPARVGFGDETGAGVLEAVREFALRSAVGAPLALDGQLWGVAVAYWRRDEPAPLGGEARMAQFAELLATAIANADSRDQLRASRARLLKAGDEARRRVVRDLHDGAQQRFVHAIVALKLAHQALEGVDTVAASLVAEALEQAESGTAALRELAHGIVPAALARGGLAAAISAAVARVGLPVEVDVPAERLPTEIETNAYFIVAEALTNVVKHAGAEHAAVTAAVEGGVFRVEVRDDGIGGVDPDGHGLTGLRDRATALGGRLDVESPPSGGTIVAATLPLPEA